MSDSQEQWTDAAVTAQCAAGIPAAWQRLKEIISNESCVIFARCRRHGPLTADLLADAVQNVLYRLWAIHAGLAGTFRPEDGSLSELLIEETCQEVHNLLRKDARRQHHEQLAATRRDEDRGDEESRREKAERLCLCLRPDDQEVLRAALEGRLSELKPRRSKRELRNAKRRIRRKWKEQQG